MFRSKRIQNLVRVQRTPCMHACAEHIQKYEISLKPIKSHAILFKRQCNALHFKIQQQLNISKTSQASKLGSKRMYNSAYVGLYVFIYIKHPQFYRYVDSLPWSKKIAVYNSQLAQNKNIVTIRIKVYTLNKVY